MSCRSCRRLRRKEEYEDSVHPLPQVKKEVKIEVEYPVLVSLMVMKGVRIRVVVMA